MKIIVLLTVLLDQSAKYCISQNMTVGEERQIFGRLYITNLKNKGMAMGVLSDQRWFVLLTSAIAMFNIFRLWGRCVGYEKAGLSFMAGGGVSNIYDRFFRKEVTDYIYFKSEGRTPVFNLADIFAVLGVLIILFTRVFRKMGDIATQKV